MSQMANFRSGQIKLISESFVKPKIHEAEASNRPPHYYLGPIDLIHLSLGYTQRGMLFSFNIPSPASSDNHQSSSSSDSHISIESFLEKLSHSLSLSLIHFYPLAGRLATQKFPADHASLIFVDCTKGPGARILHANLDLNVSDLLSPTGHVSLAVGSLFDLGEAKVNHDGHTHPLLSIQVTELLDGIFIGFTMNHAIADGTSFLQFVGSLSQLFHTDTMLRKPIPEPLFPDGYSPILKLPYLEPDEFVSRFEPGSLRERIFYFAPSSMAALKAKANQECGVLNISSFQALSGLVWRSITRARNLEPGEETNYHCMLDTRSRFDPPFSEDYFGNYVNIAGCSCSVGELLGREVGSAAMMVHKAVVARNDKAICGSLEMLSKAPFVVQPGPGSACYTPNQVIMGGYTKFDMYRPQFGFGRATAIITGFSNVFDGKVSAHLGPQREGSAQLQIALKPETMSALELDQELMMYVS